MLSSNQIEQFQRDGVLVVNNVLDSDEVQTALKGLEETLFEKGIDIHRLRETGYHLSSLSSTNGSGGVLDIYYPPWKLNLCTHQRLFEMTTQLWQAAFCHDGETLEDLNTVDPTLTYKYHPYGAFDVHQGYTYLDRIGFRIPTNLAFEIGMDMLHMKKEQEPTQDTTGNKDKRPSSSSSSSSSNRNKVAIQRSLTPHLDCCPKTFYSKENNASKHKWRPIQCFLSLTDTLEPHQGGLEAVLGFHKEFYHWATTPTSISSNQDEDDKSTKQPYTPAPCIGEYTHIRPKEDRTIFKRIQHVPHVKAGSAVFWDNRIPHSNSYFHYGHGPRIVVYCSFLPNVEINRNYVSRQLQDYYQGRIPGSLDGNGDRWAMLDNEMEKRRVCNDNNNKVEKKQASGNEKDEYNFTPLGRKLMGIDEW